MTERQPRHTAHLARPQYTIDVQYLIGRNRLAHNAAARIENQSATRVVTE